MTSVNPYSRNYPTSPPPMASSTGGTTSVVITRPDGTLQTVEVVTVTAQRRSDSIEIGGPPQAPRFGPYSGRTGAEENVHRDVSFGMAGPEERARMLGMNPYAEVGVPDEGGIQDITTYDFISPQLQMLGMRRIDLSFEAMSHIRLEHSGAFRGDKSDFDDHLLSMRNFAIQILEPVLSNPLIVRSEGNRLVVEGNAVSRVGTDQSGNSTTTVRIVLEQPNPNNVSTWSVVTAYPRPQSW
jgi:hypothetical protein